MSQYNNLMNMFGSQSVNENDLFIQIKDTINKDLKVSTFAKVVSYDVDTKIASVTPFPLIKGESTKNIKCVSEHEVTKGDIVFVVFADRNFTQNLKQAKKGNLLSALNENSDLHSDKYGVIVPLKKEQGGGGGAVEDVKVNGRSVVVDGVANITVPAYSSGNGISIGSDYVISIDTSSAEMIQPKIMSVEEQNNHSILVVGQDDALEKAPLGSLDYTRIKVVDSENLSAVDVDDFLFIKGE